MILPLLLLAIQFDANLSPKYAEAVQLLQQKKYPDAVSVLVSLTGEKPEVAEYWNALGLAYLANGDVEKSLPPLQRACTANSHVPRSCFNYGRVLLFLNRYEDAIGAFDRVPRSYEDAPMFLAKAQAYESLKRVREADRAYRSALAETAMRPANSAEVQLRYGVFLARQGSTESALWQFDQAIRKAPLWGLVWREKARVLLQLQRERDSAVALEQAIAHGERNRENLLLLSRIYAQLGDSEKAETYQREAAGPELK
ncbi:tetratricopeptide repeat protein [Bryobacter aggregatus]|uniref:tetratricopeptide repeat protein n=1 Tax=Bryobacter aggregatus TaxID=360054 RepID=UPI0004E0D9F8|nr:tetratricopeptide repeat protein [Bryobacter aggregatus]